MPVTPCWLSRVLLVSGLAAVAWVGALVAVEPASAGPAIAPHFAVYKLDLSRTQGASGVADATGRIEFKWVEGCDGWTVNQRTHLLLTNTQGDNFQSGWALDAWESKDGLSYRFALKRIYSDAEPEETRGKARLEGPGLGGVVNYSKPEGETMTLPVGTVFPTRYSEELLAAAEQNEVLFWRVVFDGAGEEGFFEVNAALSRSLPPDPAPVLDSPLLRDQPSWRMRLAYFVAAGQQAEPDHEQGQRMYANGVVDELEFDYSDFALKGTLEELEILPSPDCS